MFVNIVSAIYYIISGLLALLMLWRMIKSKCTWETISLAIIFIPWFCARCGLSRKEERIMKKKWIIKGVIFLAVIHCASHRRYNCCGCIRMRRSSCPRM
jgi:hypothetical protein